MQDALPNDLSIHISSKSHLNLTFNLYQCGIKTLLPGGRLQIGGDDTFAMLYVNKGAGKLIFNGIESPLGFSMGFFVFSDELYQMENTGEVEMDIAWLNFSGYGVESYLNRARIHRAMPVYDDVDGYLAASLTRLSPHPSAFPTAIAV